MKLNHRIIKTLLLFLVLFNITLYSDTIDSFKNRWRGNTLSVNGNSKWLIERHSPIMVILSVKKIINIDA